jgi:hypothetical protein
MTRAEVSRRRFLECFGGALVALPMLESCTKPASEERVGAGRSALSGPPAKRFVAFALWDGVKPSEWFPTGTETSFQLQSMLQPMASHQANMILMRGVDNTAALKSTDRNGHAEGVASMLSGWAPQPLANNNWRGMGKSIDQAIAESITTTGVVTRFPLVNLGNVESPYSFFSYADVDSPNYFISRAHDAFNTLFYDPTVAANARARAAARKKSILDGSIGRFQALSTKLSSEDKRRVDAHLGSLRDLEVRLNAASACDPSGLTLATEDDLSKTWRGFLDVLILALSCDLTRVATFSYGSAGGGGPQFPWTGVETDIHELSHEIPGETDFGPSTAEFVKIHQWVAGEMSYFVDRLKATPAPGGVSLFDETVIFRGTELSVNHDQVDMPFMILAGDKTPFNTGRWLQLPAATPHNQLLVTLLHAFGVNVNAWGDPRYASGNLDARFLKA